MEDRNENLEIAKLAAQSLTQGAGKKFMAARQFKVAGAVDEAGAPVIEVAGSRDDLLSIAVSLPKSVDVQGKPGEISVIPVILKPTEP